MSLITEKVKTVLMNRYQVSEKNITKLEKNLNDSGVTELICDNKNNIYIAFNKNINRTNFGITNEFQIKQQFESFDGETVKGKVFIDISKSFGSKHDKKINLGGIEEFKYGKKDKEYKRKIQLDYLNSMYEILYGNKCSIKNNNFFPNLESQIEIYQSRRRIDPDNRSEIFGKKEKYGLGDPNVKNKLNKFLKDHNLKMSDVLGKNNPYALIRRTGEDSTFYLNAFGDLCLRFNIKRFDRDFVSCVIDPIRGIAGWKKSTKRFEGSYFVEYTDGARELREQIVKHATTSTDTIFNDIKESYDSHRKSAKGSFCGEEREKWIKLVSQLYTDKEIAFVLYNLKQNENNKTIELVLPSGFKNKNEFDTVINELNRKLSTISDDDVDVKNFVFNEIQSKIKDRIAYDNTRGFGRDMFEIDKVGITISSEPIIEKMPDNELIDMIVDGINNMNSSDLNRMLKDYDKDIHNISDADLHPRYHNHIDLMNTLKKRDSVNEEILNTIKSKAIERYKSLLQEDLEFRLKEIEKAAYNLSEKNAVKFLDKAELNDDNTYNLGQDTMISVYLNSITTNNDIYDSIKRDTYTKILDYAKYHCMQRLRKLNENNEYYQQNKDKFANVVIDRNTIINDVVAVYDYVETDVSNDDNDHYCIPVSYTALKRIRLPDRIDIPNCSNNNNRITNTNSLISNQNQNQDQNQNNIGHHNVSRRK